MNLLTLRSQARLKSGVNSTDFSTSNLDEQLNVAYYQLASVISQLQADYYEEQNVKFNLVANSSLYSLPTDLMQLKQVRIAYTSPSTNSDYRVARQYDPSTVHSVSADEESIPTSFPAYDVTNNYVRIKPTPTASVTNGGKLWYIARPSALTATGDTPILPLQYHDFIGIYGAKEMSFKYQKWQKYDRLQKQWDTFIAPLMLRIQDLSDRDMGEALRFASSLEIPTSGPTRELPDSDF